jgi:predicted nucleotidyltransferase
MTDKILQSLKTLESEKNIQILLACETGSRGWGFPSPDSDYDVRLIYLHKKDWYLSLNEGKDTIELFLEKNEIDISGWDLRKSLRLLWKSNPPLLERIQSPIIYSSDPIFLAEINTLAQSSYSRIATIHHFLNMAKKALDEISESKEYKLKRFFYALRASTACLWVLEKEEIPPIEFLKMYKYLNLPEDLVQRISELIKFKASISEGYIHQGEKPLIEFMKQCIIRAEEEAKSLPSSNGSMKDFNQFFVGTLNRYDN